MLKMNLAALILVRKDFFSAMKEDACLRFSDVMECSIAQMERMRRAVTVQLMSSGMIDSSANLIKFCDITILPGARLEEGVF